MILKQELNEYLLTLNYPKKYLLNNIHTSIQYLVFRKDSICFYKKARTSKLSVLIQICLLTVLYTSFIIFL